jgi:hypothetical protein
MADRRARASRFSVALALALAIAGCERRARTPDWVLGAPAGAAMAISYQAGWALRQPQLATLLQRYPPAGAALEALLHKTRIDPRQETGRITLYLSAPAGPTATPAGTAATPSLSADFLIQLGGFRNPGRLQVAIADAFPAEGFLPRDRRDLPLFVVLEQAPWHIRAMADGEGRVWLGDLTALARFGDTGQDSADLAGSSGWISPGAAIQGFIRPHGLLRDTTSWLPGELARDLPRGVEAMAWGVSPGRGADALAGFELALAGSPDAIREAAAWLQRFADAAQAVPAAGPGAPAQAPELTQETRRIVLRCQLTRPQLDAAMARLELPCVQCGP